MPVGTVLESDAQPDQETEYKAALKRHGFCVVKVLDDAQCQASVRAMFEDVNSRQGAEAVGELWLFVPKSIRDEFR